MAEDRHQIPSGSTFFRVIYVEDILYCVAKRLTNQLNDENKEEIEEKLKRVDDKLNATAYVLAVGLQSTQPDISSYSNKRIYKDNKIGYNTNDDFFDLINRIEQQQIYKDASLSAYTSNDPIAVQNRLLNEIDQRKAKLKAEIAALRSIQ